MLTVDEYLTKILSLIVPTETTLLPLDQAGGSFLAEDLAARCAVPPFTNSAMDGFALRRADLLAAAESPASAEPSESLAAGPSESSRVEPSESTASTFTLPVSGDIPAGCQVPFTLPPGTACRIMTGAPLPELADTVIMVEDTNMPPGQVELPEQIQINKLPDLNAHVRWRGEDVEIGTVVLAAGQQLSPRALAAAAAIGYAQVPVYRRPQVAIISTGEELQPPGSPLGYGQIPNSNSILLTALLQKEQIPVVYQASVGDSPLELQAALAQASAKADLIITSGGISAGSYDVVKQLMQDTEIEFTKVAMQPGKPQGFGVYRGANQRQSYLATLPGNPVSVFVSFQVFIRPVLAALQGGKHSSTPLRHLALAGQGWKSPQGKTQYVPVQLSPAPAPGMPLLATPTHRFGLRSHLIASLHLADALAVIPSYVSEVKTGDRLELLMI